MLIDFRQRRREEEREVGRNIKVRRKQQSLPPASVPFGDQTSNPDMCPNQELNL